MLGTYDASHCRHALQPLFLLCALLGWTDVAGILALALGGLARIGEVFAAHRGILFFSVGHWRSLWQPSALGEGARDKKHG